MKNKNKQTKNFKWQLMNLGKKKKVNKWINIYWKWNNILWTEMFCSQIKKNIHQLDL